MTRWMTLLLLALVANAGVVAPAIGQETRPAAAAAPPEAVEAAAEEAPLKLNVRVMAQSVSMNSHLRFEENGNVQGESHQFNASLLVMFDGDVDVTGYRNLVIDRVVTDTGEELKIDPNQLTREMNAGWEPGRHRVNQQNRFGMGLNLPFPSPQAKKIAEITGSMEVEYAVGPIRYAVLAPMEKLAGKRVKIGNIPDSVVTVSRPDPQSVRVESSQTTWRQMASMKFVDKDGRDLPFDQRGGGSSGTRVYRNYSIQLPEDGGVVLGFYSGSKSARVTFTLRDVPIPRPPAAKTDFDVVIDAGDAPLGPAMVAAPDGNGLPVGDLPIEVEAPEGATE